VAASGTLQKLSIDGALTIRGEAMYLYTQLQSTSLMWIDLRNQFNLIVTDMPKSLPEIRTAVFH